MGGYDRVIWLEWDQKGTKMSPESGVSLSLLEALTILRLKGVFLTKFRRRQTL